MSSARPTRSSTSRPPGRGRGTPEAAGRLWRDGRDGVPPAPPGKRYVHLADRAGDVAELLDSGDERGVSYVVRSQHDRRCSVDFGDGPEDAELRDAARRWPAGGPPRTVRVSSRKGRPGRPVVLDVAWRAATAFPPRQAHGRERGVPPPVWAVRAWEAAPPDGVEAVDWLPLTNVPVGDAAAAWERVDWYACRTAVGECHKAMKTGAGIETLQLTTRERLEPAVALLSVVAAIPLALRDAGRDAATASRPASAYVPSAWAAVLTAWRHGDVRPDWTAGEFLRAMARLGGRQGRPSDGAPGWQTLWRGWAQRQAMVRGALLYAPDRSGGARGLTPRRSR